MKKLLFATFLVAASTALCSAQRASGRKSGTDAPPPPAAGATAPPPTDGAPMPPPPDAGKKDGRHKPPPPVSGAPVPPPGAGRKAGKPKPPPPHAMQEAKTLQGRVLALDANDDFVYDGFWMQSDGDSILVKFPPHLGKQVVGMVQEGASVSVSGALDKSPRGTTELRMLSMSSDGKMLRDDVQPPTAATPPTENAVSGSGQVASLQKDREGRVSGLILDNDTILRMGPGAGTRLDDLTGSGASISYTGMQHPRTGKEAIAKDYKIIHCRTITVNGKQYTM